MKAIAGARSSPLRTARACLLPLAALSLSFACDAAAQPGPSDGVWSQFTFPSEPSPRQYYGMVYDPVRERMIVIGGHPQITNDVWALSLGGPPAWLQMFPDGTPPSPRFAHSAVYQPGRDRVILFGGYDGAFRNDVWALSLAGTPGWSQLSPAGEPPAGRWAHVAIYDPEGERMIVFGGYDGSGTRGDVWALSLGDAPAWARLDPAGQAPPARTNMDGVYDAVGNRLVVFGGFNTDTQEYFGDTWALSLSRHPVWQELHPFGNGPTPRRDHFGADRREAPSPRRDHSAIYDAARRRMIVFGGFELDSLVRTYELTFDHGPQWRVIETSGPLPTARAGHRAIYDPARDRMVVFGGYDGHYLKDVWTLPLAGAASWSALPVPSYLPPARRNFGMAYAAGSLVLFGGDGGPLLNDAARFTFGDVPAWTPLPGAGSPAPRAGHHLIYDAPRQRVVVFGGATTSDFTADVHAFSLATGSWAPVDALGTPPSPRTYYGMVYDPVRERMIVIGGHPNMLNDVWALPLGGAPVWQQLSPAGTKPSPRFAHVLVYQPGRDRVVLFGGYDGIFRNDVWALSLAGTPAWSQIMPAGTPPAGRWAPAAVYDAARDRMVVFGGYDGITTRNDVWALSLGATPAWTRLSPGGPQPAARANVEGAYDPVADRLILFGGFNTATQQFFNDTWALSWQAPPPGAAAPAAVEAVAGRPRVALAGVRPNPAARELTIAFSLADGSPARLELMDVAGRRVRVREVGSLGAGDHELRFDGVQELPPGLYFVRLRQHDRALTARVLIAR